MEQFLEPTRKEPYFNKYARNNLDRNRAGVHIGSPEQKLKGPEAILIARHGLEKTRDVAMQ